MVKRFYTYQEAMRKVHDAGIKTLTEYREWQKSDPRLPSEPWRAYEEYNSSDFFGKPKKLMYYTYQEAISKVRVARVKTNAEYIKWQKSDPRLPADPRRFYDEFNNAEFFGKPIKKEFYTYQEALRKVQEAGVKTNAQYNKLKKLDPQLPSDPWRFYGEYDNAEFFGKEAKFSYQETMKKVHGAGIKTRAEYKNWRVCDPRLPSDPWRTFSEYDQAEFFGKETLQTYQETMKRVHNAGVKSQAEYKKWRNNDPQLPSAPWLYYDEFDNSEFFAKKKLYTYQEAMHIVHKAQVCTLDEYLELRKSDPRLPACPSVFYEEYENKDFFPKKYYSYKETMAKVHKAGVKTLTEYKVWQKSDPRLPSDPKQHYTEYDNKEFFAKEFFYNYQELVAKVHLAGIKTQKKFNEWQKSDPRIPSDPYRVYNEYDASEFYSKNLSLDEFAEQVKKKGITKKREYDEQLAGAFPIYPKDPVTYYGVDSFKSLIGFEYWGLDESLKYINTHKIKNSSEYFKHAKLVPYLRSHPNKIKGFVGELHYYRAKNFELFLEKYSEFKPWCDVANVYLTKGSNIPKRTSIIEKLLNWFTVKNIDSDPLVFLLKTSKVPDLNEFLATLSKQEQSINTVRIINEYVNLILKTYCTDEDEETGEIFWLPDYRNPYVNYTLSGEIRKSKPNETVKKILPFAYVDKARKFLCPDSADTFSDLVEARDIYQSDYYEVDESQIDKDDPNCIWRTREAYKNSGRTKTIIYEMWSPVRTVAMLALFELPIRGQQILWNDSGEWDEELPHYKNGKLVWEKNPIEVQSHFKTSQGFIKKYDENSFGFYCTTNKTKNVEGGYSAPYMPDHLAKWLILLRDWQMKYNPISVPTKWSNDFIPRWSHVTKSRLKRRGYEGQQCFLFRDPSAKNEVLRSRPLTTNLLKNGLPILLYHIQDEQISLATFDDFIEKDDKQNALVKTMNRYSSEYTPHSLRASIITAYLVDHKLSPVLVSKLVGHASLVMTIYYAKVTAPAMKREFERAEFEALKNKQNSINDAVMAAKFKNLKASYVDNTNGEFLTKLEGITGNAIVDKGCGICPLGGQSCHEGGELVAEKSTYRSPVPTSLVLGRSNCVRCRFFITSPVYLPGLKALFDSIALSIRDLNDRIEEVSEQLENLKDERDECECAGQSFTKTFELNRLQSVYETSVASLDGAMSDAIATYRLSDAVINLLNDETPDANDKKLPMVLNDSTLSIELRESSKFEQLHEICQYADLFMFSDPKAAVMERTQKINKMLLENNISASLYSLTIEQQKLIGNHLINNLVRRLGGWNELDNVAEKRTKLRDYLPAAELKSLTTEIKNLSNSIPIRNEALPEGEPSL